MEGGFYSRQACIQTLEINGIRMLAPGLCAHVKEIFRASKAPPSFFFVSRQAISEKGTRAGGKKTKTDRKTKITLLNSG